MVKSVLGAAHQGLRDWFWQRMSAVFMTIYVIGLFIFFVMHPGLEYFQWQGLFAHLWMKAATLLFFASLLLHTWVGIWTVITDYIVCPMGRLVLHTVVFFALAGFFFAAFFILWGV